MGMSSIDEAIFAMSVEVKNDNPLLMDTYSIIDISGIPHNLKQYNGAEDKFGITLNGSNYIVKRTRDGWNNVYSEYIASNVIRILGGNVHETYLGRLNNDIVVLCKDFTSNNISLKSFNSTESLALDTDIDRHEYYYDEVVYLLSKLKNCDLDKCMQSFNEMYVFDALLGNPDRHRGNWGVLRTTHGYRMAPIFDNGASLFPRAISVSINENWMKERIYTFPNSKIMFDNKRERSSYYEVISTKNIFDNIIQKISLGMIYDVLRFIENTLIPDNLKTLYKTVIYYRYKCILNKEDFVWEGTK